MRRSWNFLPADAFVDAGRFPDVPLMEDVEFFRRLRRCGRVVYSNKRIGASPRRYQTVGPARLTFAFGSIAALYLSASPYPRLPHLPPHVLWSASAGDSAQVAGNRSRIKINPRWSCARLPYLVRTDSRKESIGGKEHENCEFDCRFGCDGRADCFGQEGVVQDVKHGAKKAGETIKDGLETVGRKQRRLLKRWARKQKRPLRL